MQSSRMHHHSARTNVCIWMQPLRYYISLGYRHPVVVVVSLFQIYHHEENYGWGYVNELNLAMMRHCFYFSVYSFWYCHYYHVNFGRNFHCVVSIVVLAPDGCCDYDYGDDYD